MPGDCLVTCSLPLPMSGQSETLLLGIPAIKALTQQKHALQTAQSLLQVEPLAEAMATCNAKSGLAVLHSSIETISKELHILDPLALNINAGRRRR